MRGRIFATLCSETTLNVMAPEELIRAAVACAPDACSLRIWGRRLAAVQIELAGADEQLVADLLHAAWSERA